jgi:hypothetical protein
MRFATLFLLFTAALSAADLTGNWTASVETSAGSGSPSFVLKQEGNTLTGTYSGQLGEAPLKGSISGDDFEWVINLEASGQSIKIVYKGKVKSSTEIGGSVVLGELAEGTFTAKKKA